MTCLPRSDDHLWVVAHELVLGRLNISGSRRMDRDPYGCFVSQQHTLSARLSHNDLRRFDALIVLVGPDTHVARENEGEVFFKVDLAGEERSSLHRHLPGIETIGKAVDEQEIRLRKLRELLLDVEHLLQRRDTRNRDLWHPRVVEFDDVHGFVVPRSVITSVPVLSTVTRQ